MHTWDVERASVADACRRMAHLGLVVGTAGNVSVRIEDRVAITATGARFEDMTLDQVSVIDLDGVLVAGDLEPTSELDLHLGVYERFDTTSVVHTHSPVATAVGLVVDELPCVHYQMLLLGGDVRVAPYATFGTPELADAVLTALEGKSAALMANHGAITHAGTLDAAVDQTVLLEWACTVFWRASSIGTPRSLSAPEQEAVIVQAMTRQYGTTRPVTTEETP